MQIFALGLTSDICIQRPRLGAGGGNRNQILRQEMHNKYA